VEAGTREMSQSRVIAVVIGGVFLVVLAGLLVGSVRPTPIVEKSQGREEASAPSPVSDLGLAALVGALAGAVGTHVLRERAEAKRETRELQGLLRMLYVEIEVNRGEAELLLNAPNLNVGWWTDNVYKDDTWKEVRSRLSQLLLDEDNFNRLVDYYANNAPNEKGIVKMIESGRSTSLAAPGDAFARVMAEKTRGQRDLAVDILDMIQGYIGDPPIGRESVEDAKREVERHQRELDAERDRRKE
jgi:hypothetical protein